MSRAPPDTGLPVAQQLLAGLTSTPGAGWIKEAFQRAGRGASGDLSQVR